MIEPEVLIGALIAIFIFVGSQVTKLAAPEFMNKYGRWAVVLFGVTGAVLSLVFYLAAHDGKIIVESNNWEAVIVVLQELIKGFGIGIAPVGIYNFARPVAPNIVRSSDEILVARTPATMSGEVAIPVTTVETNVETVSVTDEATVTLKPKKAKKV